MMIYTLYSGRSRSWNPTQAKTGLEWGTQSSLLVEKARPVRDSAKAASLE
jgi:hypothetical protein